MPADSAPEPRPPVNHVFVDYENVGGMDLSIVDEKAVYLTLLLGPQQTKLQVDLVEKLMAHAASVQLVRLESAGKNALDFTLAYYLGRAVQADPNAHFHVISKDKGFDPLIKHLNGRHIRVTRHADCTTLPFAVAAKTAVVSSKPQTKTSPEELLPCVVEHLRKRPNSLPKTRKTLRTFLKGQLGKQVTGEKDLDDLVERLVQDGHITLGVKNAVTYHLD